MKTQYDVIVVGAGPAGSTAARRAAEAGLDTLLIEKRQEIGVPVRCAEAVGIPSTEPFLPISDRWVDAYIDAYAILNADGDCVKVPPAEPTIIVNRKVFDYELALIASRAGAEVVVGASASGLILEDGAVRGVHIRHMGRTVSARAKLVVAADGTESQVARWAGLKTVPPMADYYVAVQYLLGNLKGRIDPRTCEYHLGRSLAPGGYGWVFPKSEDTANVGLVLSAKHAREISPREYLDQFIRRYPDAHVLSIVTGGIPVTGALKEMVTDGLVTVGDAAHQADPLTAGGINLGMIGAEMAISVAAPAIHRGEPLTKALLREYERLWNERFGRMHGALYKIRKLLTDMDEAQLNDLIKTASRMPIDHMTPGQVLMALLKKRPQLLIEAATLMATGLIMK